MTHEPTPTRRTLLTENSGVKVDTPASPTLPFEAADPLATSLPAWDLLPATQFVRRR